MRVLKPLSLINASSFENGNLSTLTRCAQNCRWPKNSRSILVILTGFAGAATSTVQPMRWAAVTARGAPNTQSRCSVRIGTPTATGDWTLSKGTPRWLTRSPPGRADLILDPLLFERSEGAFRYFFVMTISAAAHAGYKAMGFQDALPVMATELTALIDVHKYLVLRSSAPRRHERRIPPTSTTKG